MAASAPASAGLCTGERRTPRCTPLTGRHTHYQERRAALLTSLANVSGRRFAWQYVRLFFGSLGDRYGHRRVSRIAMVAYGTVALLTGWLRVGYLWAYGFAFGCAHGVLYPTLSTDGVHVCVTATLLDGVVLARSVYKSSLNYRSAVVLGHARKVEDTDEKRLALEAVVDTSPPATHGRRERRTMRS